MPEEIAPLILSSAFHRKSLKKSTVITDLIDSIHTPLYDTWLCRAVLEWCWRDPHIQMLRALDCNYDKIVAQYFFNSADLFGLLYRGSLSRITGPPAGRASRPYLKGPPGV